MRSVRGMNDSNKNLLSSSSSPCRRRKRTGLLLYFWSNVYVDEMISVYIIILSGLSSIDPFIARAEVCSDLPSFIGTHILRVFTRCWIIYLIKQSPAYHALDIYSICDACLWENISKGYMFIVLFDPPNSLQFCVVAHDDWRRWWLLCSSSIVFLVAFHQPPRSFPSLSITQPTMTIGDKK